MTSRSRLIGLCAAPLCLALAAGCGRGGGEPAQKAAPGAPGAAPPAIAVTVAPAVAEDITRVVQVTGSLVARQDVTVGPKTAGRVAAVYPREGDSVTRGQVVAVMDMADFRSGVEQARAGLQAALTREQQARVALQQARDAFTNAQTTLQWTDRTTRAAVETARASLESARESLEVVREGARPQERKQAEEQVASAKAGYDKARADLKRMQELYREQAVSASQLDQAQAAFDSAQAGYNSAQQALSLIREGARPQDIRRAELGVRQAQEALERAQADRAQVKMREQDVATARKSISSVLGNVTAAQAGVRQAQAALDMARKALGDANVYAPISGFVASRTAEPGQQLGSGAPILRIVNPSTVYFQGALPESQFSQVRLNQRVDVTVDALAGRVFAGRVARILPVASAARTFTVRVDIRPDPRLRPQMFARGAILIDTHRAATLVPKDAVIFDPARNRTRVFVVGPGNKVSLRVVTTGYTNPKSVEVLSGVKPGEKVVVAGQNNLDNGDVVRVQ